MASSAWPSTASIHASASIHPTAVIGEDVKVGPFCVVGPAVRVGARTNLIASVTIIESTHIGSDCEIFPNVVVGGKPQVHGFKSSKPDIEKPLVVIGNKCIIRELVTIHQSSKGPDFPTWVGDGAYLMTSVHVAHDCVLEKNVTLVTGVGLAGHCTIMEGATVGGQSGLHQNVRVGREAFVAAGTVLSHDALPYSVVQGNRAKTKGLNNVGLKRKGWSDERINHLLQTMNRYFKTGKIAAGDVNDDVQAMLDFAKGTQRGIALPQDASSPKRNSKM